MSPVRTLDKLDGWQRLWLLFAAASLLVATAMVFSDYDRREETFFGAQGLAESRAWLESNKTWYIYSVLSDAMPAMDENGNLIDGWKAQIIGYSYWQFTRAILLGLLAPGLIIAVMKLISWVKHGFEIKD